MLDRRLSRRSPSRALLRRFAIGLGLTAVLLAGCAAPPEDAQSEAMSTDPGRAAFEAVPLPVGDTVGADPMALAQDLYGISEPVEGNYSEAVELLSKTADQQVVLFTQVGLPDDSVRARRHRLEFEPQGTRWQLTWAGRQVQCRPGRGHEDWGTALCR
ncbi:hypothetical protein CKO31_23300 [Thiohalocapsa halophila]|uniref:Lipoprotein n=2 Tax=Thiohalocapsa halophila TaxID=69359 RepID=A0ABS1CNU9_9GAMM|nr:hypothetical protein [Thiohalocapsa halophila]